jgi:hypothetical protein
MSDTNTFLQEFEIQERARDRRPLTERADPLALSWAAYRVWQKFPDRRWAPWSDLEIHEHDHDMSRITRQYYRDRLAMRALKSPNEPTEFARDLYDICTGGVMRVCHTGLLYRLPYFYVEDTETDSLMDRYPDCPGISDIVPAFLLARETRSLKPDCMIFRSRRSGEIMRYWFRDLGTGHPVSWNVKYDNPLRSVVDHLHRSRSSIVVSAQWRVTHVRMDGRPDFYHWMPIDVELLNE